jgi:hypothetical protein
MSNFSFARRAMQFGLSGPLQIVAAAAAMTALADWLFYMHPPGISFAIFIGALCAAVLVVNPIRASRTARVAAVAILAASLLPVIEDFGFLSLVFAVAGTAAFALLSTGWPPRPAVQRLFELGWMIISGPFRLAADIGSLVYEIRQRDMAKHGANWLMAWIVPIGVSGLFLLLLAQANPLIETWFTHVDTSNWKNLDPVRPLFWLLGRPVPPTTLWSR